LIRKEFNRYTYLAAINTGVERYLSTPAGASSRSFGSGFFGGQRHGKDGVINATEIKTWLGSLNAQVKRFDTTRPDRAAARLCSLLAFRAILNGPGGVSANSLKTKVAEALGSLQSGSTLFKYLCSISGKRADNGATLKKARLQALYCEYIDLAICAFLEAKDDEAVLNAFAAKCTDQVLADQIREVVVTYNDKTNKSLTVPKMEISIQTTVEDASGDDIEMTEPPTRTGPK
jgi:hypothetical protein